MDRIRQCYCRQLFSVGNIPRLGVRLSASPMGGHLVALRPLDHPFVTATFSISPFTAAASKS
jgi:hypothetical protein